MCYLHKFYIFICVVSCHVYSDIQEIDEHVIKECAHIEIMKDFKLTKETKEMLWNTDEEFKRSQKELQEKYDKINEENTRKQQEADDKKEKEKLNRIRQK